MTGGDEQQGRRARVAGTWLGGVRTAGVDLGYPGERLGLPKEGPGSVAPYGRRLLALFIDWLLALLITSFLLRIFGAGSAQRTLWPVLTFGLMVWLLTGLIGLTIGKRLLGLRVARLDGRPVGLLWSLVRTVLLVAVVPALAWDRDYRGLHDRAAGTIVIRA
ncbi:MAG TPA: RDD family protein [Streptosporangiaceae bacterium]|jgi:uncharacterized RDD family membrane protein YckC|nr:RDD family protein [Streptosporangiaceae bacterium]